MTLLHQAAQKAVEAPEYVGWQFRYVFEDQNDRRGSWGCVLDGIRTMPNNHRPYDADRPGRRCRYEVRDVYAGPVGGGPPALQHQEVPREPVADYEQMRLTLIGQVHELLDIAERHAWTKDPEEKHRTEGSIAHARKVTAPYNYNGAASPSTTRQQEVGKVCVCDELGFKCKWCALKDMRLAAAPSTPESAEKDDAGGVPAGGEGQQG